MEKLIQQLKAWKENLWPQAKATTPATPSAPSETTIRRARITVEAASASIANAYSEWGTTVSVLHEGNAYLITSAHITNNRSLVTKGFDYYGKKLFPIIKGNQLAFAEHIAVNPQGSVCRFSGNGNTSQPFREISILRLLSPAQSREALYNLSFGADSRTRLNSVLGFYPTLPAKAIVAEPTAEMLDNLTKKFALPPILTGPTLPSVTNIPAYSIGYNDNKPHHASTFVSDAKENKTSIQAKVSCTQVIEGGHSGGFMFNVNADGSITPLGIVNYIDVGNFTAHATKYSEVMEGLATVALDQTIKEKTTLDAICIDELGISKWYNPSAIQVGSSPLPSAKDAKYPNSITEACRKQAAAR